MMFSGDESYGDEITSGPATDENLNGFCDECGADLDDEDHRKDCSFRDDR
jgi:hypothetical protein